MTARMFIEDYVLSAKSAFVCSCWSAYSIVTGIWSSLLGLNPDQPLLGAYHYWVLPLVFGLILGAIRLHVPLGRIALYISACAILTFIAYACHEGIPRPVWSG